MHRGVPEVVTTTRKRESNLRIFCKAQPCATVKPGDMPSAMTRQDIEQKMDELAREYHDTHDQEIPEESFELAGRLREMEH